MTKEKLLGIKGLVSRIDSFDPETIAVVTFFEGENYNGSAKIKVKHLLQEKIAYSDAVFNISYDSTEGLSFIPDVEQNEKKRQQLEEVYRKFLEESC